MRHFIVLVAGVLLTGIAADDEATSHKVPPADICNEFGNDFCTDAATCNASTNVKGTFTCKCERDNTYFDAKEKLCQYKTTCKTVECAVGRCKEDGPHRAQCVCENSGSLTLTCGVRDHFRQDCEKMGGTVIVPKGSSGEARCDCGEWAVKKSNPDKCVPTTCLYPGLSCKDLCEKNLLDKDRSCCEGWDQNDCSKAPKEGTYCSPGTVKKDEGCKSACDSGEAGLLCKHGCKRSQIPGRSYECRCLFGSVVAEDGIQCKVKTKVCTQEEKQKCLSDQRCIVRENRAVCECPQNQQLLDGKCTGECAVKKCHENFTDCGVHYGKEGCFCPWTLRKIPGSYRQACTLNEYYYTVSFKPKISLDTEDCKLHNTRVLQAMQTTIGPEVFMVEVLSCTVDIKARLITSKKLSPYLLKKLQICDYPGGDACIIYPKLPIQKDSATEIEEENLCDSLLKIQADATKDTNECVRDGDHFWFKCKRGYREVDLKTKGRLRRSVCEPGVSCDVKDEEECQKTGHICEVEGTGAVCKCSRGKIEDQGNCKVACTQEKKEECEKKGEECVVDNDEIVCRKKGSSTVTTQAPSVPATCTDERKEQCQKKDEECVVQNGEAVCKPKGASAATTQAPPIPEICTQEKKEQCEKKGEECIAEKGQAVCKTKGASTATTQAPSVPQTCTQERKEQCEKKGEECIVEKGEAACKTKGPSTATTQAPPGSGSSTVAVSAVFILAILIPALYTQGLNL